MARFRRKEISMTARRFALVLAVLTVSAWGPEVSAQVSWWPTVVRGDAAIITLDVLPLEAEVRLDGVLLGTARELTAQVVPVVPGNHVVQVSAAGHLSSGVRFSTPRDGVNHVQVQLVPAFPR
jgi:hypothetical protein